MLFGYFGECFCIKIFGMSSTSLNISIHDPRSRLKAYLSLKYSANSSLSLSAFRRRVCTWSMPSLGRSVYMQLALISSLRCLSRYTYEKSINIGVGDIGGVCLFGGHNEGVER